MTLTAQTALAKLRAIGNRDDATFLQRFFKTGVGEYGEGDVFLGIRVPATRDVAKEFRDLSLDEIEKLLHAREHEARLLAVIILADQYKRADQHQKQQIFDLYLANTRFINNWDIVDSSAPQIVGAHLFGGSTKNLDKLAKSEMLWERRIAIVATLYFIRKGELTHTLRIAEALLLDEHDLIHKATGWMLREAGKKDVAVLRGFLDRHHREMPRTMLRYAIEKLDARTRAAYLAR